MNRLFQPAFAVVHALSAAITAVLLAAHIGAVVYHVKKWRE